MATCAGCGQPVSGGRGTPRRWCTEACRLATFRERQGAEVTAILARLAGALGPEHRGELDRLAGLLGVAPARSAPHEAPP
jgi:hypothetical protein